jgi:signal peptidase I
METAPTAEPATPTSRGPHRKGWVAALLSLLLSGLGHLYAGSWRRALAFFVGVSVIQVGGLLTLMHLRTEPLNFYLPLSVYLLYRVTVIVDAVRVARRAPAFRWPWYFRWPVYLAPVFPGWYAGGLQVALLLHTFVVQTFHMPVRSMSDTIMPGDYILVDKLFYSEPARLDVVAFQRTDPEFGEQVWVKRIIGLPGEQVQIVGHQVLIDGRELREPYVLLDDREPPDFGPLVVPEGTYFVLGDNRGISKDSRHPDVGCVPRDRIFGRAMTIFVSVDPWTDEIRWDRVGKLIR